MSDLPPRLQPEADIARQDTVLMIWITGLLMVSSCLAMSYVYDTRFFEEIARIRLAILLVLPSCLLLVNLGQVQAAAQVLIWGQWLISLEVVFHNSGLNGPMILSFPIQVASAAWLLGPRSALAVGLLNTAYMLALPWFEAQGWLPQPRFQRELAPHLVVLTNMAVALTIALLSRRSYQRQLLQAQATRQAWQAQDEELHKLVSLIEQCPIGIVITDTQRRIEYVNPAFIGRTGLNAAAFRNLPAELLSTPGLSAQQRISLQQAMAQGQTWRGEQSLLLPDGQRVLEDVEIGPIRRANGEITHWFELKKDITASRWAADQIERLVYVDALTGLPKRAALQDRLMQVQTAPGSTWNLLMLKLDGLGQLNEFRGPQAGDACLQQLGQALRQHLPEAGSDLFRLGGSEFVALLPAHLTPPEVEACAWRVHQAVTGYTGRPTRPLSEVRLLLGATVLAGDEEDPLTQGMRRASLAVRQARHEAPGRPCWYAPGLGQQARQRLLARSDLGLTALAPLLRLDLRQRQRPDGQACGHWAALRWAQASGPRAPLQEVARRADLGFELDEELIARVCRCQRQGTDPASGPSGALPLTLALVTPLLQQDTAAQWLQDCLQRHPIQRQALGLALSTHDLGWAANDPTSALRRLQRLREAGFRLCLQDVGLGYPGVLELPRWPVHEWLLAPALLGAATGPGAAQALLQAIVAAARDHAKPLMMEGELPASLRQLAPELIRQAAMAPSAPSP